MDSLTFSFDILTSHKSATENYSGESSFVFKDKHEYKDFIFLAINLKELKIKKSSGNKYECLVTFRDAMPNEQKRYFVENFAHFITHKMASRHNHYYGSPYIQVDWAHYYMNSKTGLSDYVHLSSKNFKNFDDYIPQKRPYPDISRFFYHGMKSNNIKSKYFNLFLILEFLEYSDRYKQLFSEKNLFDRQEKEKINALAASMESSIKKGVIKSILGRTEKPRAIKLFELLHDIGLESIDFLVVNSPLTIETVRKLIETRNILFHQGERIDENIIWGILIPLTRTIVEKINNEPKLLAKRP